jgi:flagellar protein FlbT
MPLSINLKPRERLVLNGVIVENSGPAARILIHNEAVLLRARDMITEESACTPARRLYYALQCLYLSPDRGGELSRVTAALAACEAAGPDWTAALAEIRGHVASGDFYRGLRAAKPLLRRERDTAGAGPAV